MTDLPKGTDFSPLTSRTLTKIYSLSLITPIPEVEMDGEWRSQNITADSWFTENGE